MSVGGTPPGSTRGMLSHRSRGIDSLQTPRRQPVDGRAGIAVLRVLDLHVPPALAVALLPMVMDHPTYAYPFSVGIGTLSMTLWFRGWKALATRHFPDHPT